MIKLETPKSLPAFAEGGSIRERNPGELVHFREEGGTACVVCGNDYDWVAGRHCWTDRESIFDNHELRCGERPRKGDKA